MINQVEIIEGFNRINNALGEAIKNLIVSSSTTNADFTTPFIMYLNVFLLACFLGYFVIWNVKPALHAPLMSVTNAISSVIVVGAILAAGQSVSLISSIFGFFAVVLSSINIFGGFYITYRMLEMFSNKDKEGK